MPRQFHAIHKLFSEVNALSIQLKRLASQSLLSAGELDVLRVLSRQGPLTVPRVGRARSTSRQNTQVLVNKLALQDAVRFVDNPAHKTSPLVELTAHGVELFGQETQQEEERLRHLVGELSESELDAGVALLRRIRDLLDTGEEEARQTAEDAGPKIVPLPSFGHPPHGGTGDPAKSGQEEPRANPEDSATSAEDPEPPVSRH